MGGGSRAGGEEVARSTLRPNLGRSRRRNVANDDYTHHADRVTGKNTARLLVARQQYSEINNEFQASRRVKKLAFIHYCRDAREGLVWTLVDGPLPAFLSRQDGIERVLAYLS